MNNTRNGILWPTCFSLQKAAGICVLMLFSIGSFGQKNNGTFLSNEPFDPKASGNLYISVDNLNFFKNNELKTNYVDGYTLTGSWIRPKLLFYPDNKLRIELGGHVLKYNGRDDYKLYPWYSLIYKPIKQLSFRIGNLDPDENHGLPEAIMESEHFLKDKPEAGIQAKFKNRRIKADFWIDWQKMIFDGDPYKERFVFGTVAQMKLYENKTKTLTFPLVFNGKHEGGEIDTDPGPVKTHIVVSEGLRYEYKTGGTLVKSGLLECSFLQSTYPKQETALPGKSGIAFYIQTAMYTDYGCFGSGYWFGNKFFTPLGMPMFQNGAIGKTEAVDQNHLVVLTYRYERKIFDLTKFGFASDLFYNPGTRRLSNCAALYLMLNLDYALLKQKK
jgi:hypothetical protein